MLSIAKISNGTVVLLADGIQIRLERDVTTPLATVPLGRGVEQTQTGHGVARLERDVTTPLATVPAACCLQTPRRHPWRTRSLLEAGARRARARARQPCCCWWRWTTRAGRARRSLRRSGHRQRLHLPRLQLILPAASSPAPPSSPAPIPVPPTASTNRTPGRGGEQTGRHGVAKLERDVTTPVATVPLPTAVPGTPRATAEPFLAHPVAAGTGRSWCVASKSADAACFFFTKGTTCPAL